MRFSASFLRIIIVISFCSLIQQAVFAQLNRGNDTSYYEYFPGSITTRFYFSQKYTAFTLKDKDKKDLRYFPNTTLNMGVGATYHNFSLNLAYGWNFLNKDDNKGDTKYLDLQGHFYKPKTVIDVFGQFYKGYHLGGGYLAPAGQDYYYLPEAKVNLFGLSYYHVFNSKRFSYRAALIQNEWQKKSAGTFLLGAEAYYGIIDPNGDWVPLPVAGQYKQDGIAKVKYFSIGPGAGYAYTLVLFQHVYLTGSLTANLNLTATTEYISPAQDNKFTLQSVTRFRVAAGYNGRLWNVSANWIADNQPFIGPYQNAKYSLNTGNYRFIIARRLFPGPKLKKPLRLADAIFKE